MVIVRKGNIIILPLYRTQISPFKAYLFIRFTRRVKTPQNVNLTTLSSHHCLRHYLTVHRNLNYLLHYSLLKKRETNIFKHQQSLTHIQNLNQSGFFLYFEVFHNQLSGLHPLSFAGAFYQVLLAVVHLPEFDLSLGFPLMPRPVSDSGVSFSCRTKQSILSAQNLLRSMLQ